MALLSEHLMQEQFLWIQREEASLEAGPQGCFHVVTIYLTARRDDGTAPRALAVALVHRQHREGRYGCSYHLT